MGSRDALSRESTAYYFDSVIEKIERKVNNVDALYAIFAHEDERIQSCITGYLSKCELFVLGATCTELYKKIILSRLERSVRAVESSSMTEPSKFLSSIESDLPVGEDELRSAHTFYRRKGLSRLLDYIRIVDRIRDPLPVELITTVQRFIFGDADQSEGEFFKALTTYLNRRHRLLSSFRGYPSDRCHWTSNTAELLLPPKPRGVYQMLINRALFERFDTDADGILSVAELAKLVESELNVDVARSSAVAQAIVPKIMRPTRYLLRQSRLLF